MARDKLAVVRKRPPMTQLFIDVNIVGFGGEESMAVWLGKNPIAGPL